MKKSRTRSTRSSRKTRKTTLLSALCLGLMLLPTAAGAAPQDEEDTVFEDATGTQTSAGKTSGKTTVLDEVVVTATRIERRPIDVPITTEIISQEDIQLSGATDMGELLGKHITGHLHRYNGLLSSAGMRGFRTDTSGFDTSGHVLILIDGHRVGTGNVAKINMDRIERVEVIKGPASALYGSAAMGGVINLITKKGDGDLGGSLGFEYGSFDYFKAIGTLGGEVNDKLRFFATVSGDTVGDYDDPKFGTVYNTGTDKFNFGGNLTYSINDNHEIRVGGNYAHLITESPAWPTDPVTWNTQTYTYYLKDVKDYSNKSTGYADLEYNGSWLDGVLRWRGLVYYLQDKNHWFSGRPDPESDQSKNIDKTWGTDHQFTWKMNEWNTLLAGFLLDSTERKSWSYQGYQAGDPYSPAMEYDNQAVFIQDSLDLWDNRVNIVLAGRYDRFEVETKAPQTGDPAKFPGNSDDFSHFSPKLGASIKFFDERLRLRGNLAQGFKAPTADQLAANYYSYGTHYVGNPNLDPETSLTYGFGVDLFIDAFTVKIDWYHTDYNDRIQGGYTPTGDYTWTNVSDAKIGGLDLLLEWQIDKTFTDLPFTAKLWSNMTFILENENKATGEDLYYISDYEIKSGLNFGWNDFNAQLNYVFIGPQMNQNFDAYPYPAEKKGSFSFWDLTMSYTIANHWELKAGVYNLFDQDVEWVRGYLMPERNYRVGLTYKF